MTTKKKTHRSHADDLRGAARVVIDATKRTTDVVQKMHVTIASGPSLLGRPLEGPARAITDLVYGSIRGVTHAVGAGIDLALGQLAPLLGESVPGFERAAVVAALNGVIGDYLHDTGNPLATEMCLCHDGEPLDLERQALSRALPSAGGSLLVLAHGSSMNDLQWTRDGHDHGVGLARDLGLTSVYVRYNSGLHISTNGAALAAMLEELARAWPVPLRDITLLGHSMGGLVARSACYAAEQAGLAWRSKLTRLVTIGTPHHGAPLERSGNLFELLLGVSRYSAPLARLAKLRSAGVTDLRYGNVLEEHWRGRDRFAAGGDPRAALPLPAGVMAYALAGTLSPKPAKALRGDGLVRVDSALGRHADRAMALAFPDAHRSIAFGVAHLDLLSSPAVYETLRAWLQGDPPDEEPLPA
jgi:pimeloyl-ACP methyl ester carboxylesterase